MKILFLQFSSIPEPSLRVRNRLKRFWHSVLRFLFGGDATAPNVPVNAVSQDTEERSKEFCDPV